MFSVLPGQGERSESGFLEAASGHAPKERPNGEPLHDDRCCHDGDDGVIRIAEERAHQAEKGRGEGVGGLTDRDHQGDYPGGLFTAELGLGYQWRQGGGIANA